MSSTPKRAAILLSEDTEGRFSIDLRLSHDPSQQTFVPQIDILALALTNLAVSADVSVDEAIQRVHAAYELLRNGPDPRTAAQAFNDAIGVQIYNVRQTNEDDPS